MSKKLSALIAFAFLLGMFIDGCGNGSAPIDHISIVSSSMTDVNSQSAQYLFILRNNGQQDTDGDLRIEVDDSHGHPVGLLSQYVGPLPHGGSLSVLISNGQPGGETYHWAFTRIGGGAPSDSGSGLVNKQ